MLGPTHRCFAALAGATAAVLTGQTWAMVVMTALVASATGAGNFSPDLDQSATWRHLTRWLPERMRKHRGLTHWPEVPIVAWLLVDQLPADAQWPAQALLIGWASHLVGDAIFGYLPVLLGSCTLGFGLRTGGFVETGRARLLGRERRLLPLSPARLVMAGLLAALFIGGFPAGTQEALTRFPAAATGAR